MSKVEFSINDWRNKHIVKEGVGGVTSKRAFDKMPGMFRSEAVDHIDDKEAAKDYDELKDKDIDNDGDQDKSDEYLHHKLGNVAKRTDEELEEAPSDEEDMDAIMHDAPDRYNESFNIREWQKKFYGNKRNLKWG